MNTIQTARGCGDVDPNWIAGKTARLYESHIAPLTEYVHQLRQELLQRRIIAREADIPYFDPDDGGIGGRILLVKEAPGPSAIERPGMVHGGSGFVAPENKGPTAKNLCELRNEAPLTRHWVTNWNIVPWYVGNEDGTMIRPPTKEEVRQGMEYLKQLITLLPELRVVILMGNKAQKGWTLLSDYSHPPDNRQLHVLKTWHPSPVALNRCSERRQEILDTFRQAQRLASIAA